MHAYLDLTLSCIFMHNASSHFKVLKSKNVEKGVSASSFQDNLEESEM